MILLVLAETPRHYYGGSGEEDKASKQQGPKEREIAKGYEKRNLVTSGIMTLYISNSLSIIIR